MTGPALRVRLDDRWEAARRRVKPLCHAPAIRLAGLRRRRLRDVAFVGVTGSCGKTMAHGMCAAALGSRFRGSASRDSNNGLCAVACMIPGAPRGAASACRNSGPTVRERWRGLASDDGLGAQAAKRSSGEVGR